MAHRLAVQVQVEGNLLNQGGTLAAGRPVGSTAIHGDYHQELGSLQIEIGGLVQDNDYDFVDITGQLVISGGTTAAGRGTAVPEPSTLISAVLGLLSLAGWIRPRA